MMIIIFQLSLNIWHLEWDAGFVRDGISRPTRNLSDFTARSHPICFFDAMPRWRHERTNILTSHAETSRFFCENLWKMNYVSEGSPYMIIKPR
jgi:hypothetical protein